jgi:hypothetical protein
MRKLKIAALYATACLLAVAGGIFMAEQPAMSQSAGQVQVISPLTRDIGAIQTLTAQAAGTLNSADQSGFNVTRVICVYRQASHTGTPSVTFSFQNKDAVSGTYYTTLTSAAITTDSTNGIAFGADLTPSANTVASFPVARTWRTSVTVGGTTPVVTATVGCSLQ